MIVGAGHAGVELAFELRKHDASRHIILLSAEDVHPYQRPILSKQYLASPKDEPLWLRPPSAYAERMIDLRLGARVTSIDCQARQLHLQDGARFEYGQLVLATGGVPRTLALPGLSGKQPSNLGYLRTLADARALRSQLRPDTTLAIVGAGYIGLEVAAAARAMGATVHVFEQHPRLLSRVASPELATFIAEAHQREGVNLHLGTTLEACEMRDDVRIARLGYRTPQGDCQTLDVDTVLVGIGIAPDVQLAAASGLETGNGIIVDTRFRTSDPFIHALGDCAIQHHSFYERAMRIESIPNALEQARALSRVLLDQAAPPQAPPWFWSEQYHLKVQSVGIPSGYDTTILRGSPCSQTFAAFHLRERRVIAVEAVNKAREFLACKKLVVSGVQVDPSRLADEKIDLTSLIG